MSVSSSDSSMIASSSPGRAASMRSSSASCGSRSETVVPAWSSTRRLSRAISPVTSVPCRKGR